MFIETLLQYIYTEVLLKLYLHKYIQLLKLCINIKNI
jgi:hypothetical protein